MGYFQYMGHSICALEPFAVSDLHQLQTVPITNLTEIIFLFLLLQFNIFNFKIFDSYRDIKPDNLLLDSKVYTNLSSVFILCTVIHPWVAQVEGSLNSISNE